jgi:hypothetical protein
MITPWISRSRWGISPSVGHSYFHLRDSPKILSKLGAAFAGVSRTLSRIARAGWVFGTLRDAAKSDVAAMNYELL